MWTEEEQNYLISLTNYAGNKRWHEIAEQMNKEFSCNKFTYNSCRGRWRHNIKNTTPTVTPGYKDEIEILPNGSVKCDKLIELSVEQEKDPQYILEAMGMDNNEWKLNSVKLSRWNHSNKEHGTSIMYACKITASPIKDGVIDWQLISDNLNSKIKPREPIATKHSSIGYLVVPLFDLHFGNNSFADYQESLNKIHSTLAGGFQKILIIVGGDLLHNDNHKGMTSSGTVIDKVDMSKAWEDSFDYIDSIIAQSAKYSVSVEVVYVPGNHDEMTGQTVIKALDRIYRENNRITIDSEHKMFKAALLGHNFIGMAHGDKSSRKKYPMLFATNYSTMWGKNKVVTREAYTGHLHFEQTLDMDGLLIRQAPTRNKADQWHTDNGFNSSHKRFMLVQYNEYEPETVYYI